MVDDLIRHALQEDLGLAGDVTTMSVVGADETSEATIVARRDGRMAGGPVSARVFEILDSGVRCQIQTDEGEDFRAGDTLLVLLGCTRSLLSGERTALNILGHLCGVATLTREYCRAVAGTDAAVVCTRKTTPGLRALEKYAVRCGGGGNHRFGLFDAVLIKDNHVAAAGGVRWAVRRAREAVGHMVKIELEVDTLAQLEEGLAEGVDAVLLDNMDPQTLREAVELVGGRCLTEASGGINLETAAEVAATGVDLLSVGALTHSAPWLDLSLELRPETR
jgi:nicotinate-nucleotide pyrophosphorylase (carboxylating)